MTSTLLAFVILFALLFGGVPIGVKELDSVLGWPDSHASVPLRHQVGGHTATQVQRMRDDGGAVLVGQTTASEFGGVNVTRTVWLADRAALTIVGALGTV